MTGLVDAHFHIWRQADLPWLMGPMQPRGARRAGVPAAHHDHVFNRIARRVYRLSQ
jgi:hypothetical protein